MKNQFSEIKQTCRVTWLQVARVRFNQAGSSKSSVNTFSFNSRLCNSPWPFKVLKCNLSGDRFFANLKRKKLFS